MAIPPRIQLIQLKNIPILKQLQLEEALLRGERENYCIINLGSPRAIVMGISGKPVLDLDLERVRENQIPVIRRFSGGGTVIVDENTLFITFIMGKSDFEIHPFPKPILRWSADLYQESWKILNFQLIENDYCIKEKKCGGNAQYIQKMRWLHHTTFLWDYSEKNMEYLTLPPKRPKYRGDRPHLDFLTKLKNHAPSPSHLIDLLKKSLSSHLDVVDFDFKTWEERPHRKSTVLLEI